MRVLQLLSAHRLMVAEWVQWAVCISSTSGVNKSNRDRSSSPLSYSVVDVFTLYLFSNACLSYLGRWRMRKLLYVDDHGLWLKAQIIERRSNVMPLLLLDHDSGLMLVGPVQGDNLEETFHCFR